MATTVRRTVLTLPAAPVGPPNPLPALRPLDEMHSIDERAERELPREMARQIGYEPLRTLLPVRVLDGYGRERNETGLDAIVIENERLRVTVLPGLGGRIHSLHHKPTGRELLYRNPVFQPADFALNGAWYSGGIEWNIGATGHTTLSCAPCTPPSCPRPTAARWSGSGSGSGCAICRSRWTCGCPPTPTSSMSAYGFAIRTSGPRRSTGGPTSPSKSMRRPACSHRPRKPGTSATSGACAGCPCRSSAARTVRTRCAASTPPTTSMSCRPRHVSGSPRWTRTDRVSYRPRPMCCAAASSSSGARGAAGSAGRSG